ncbi:hypothetical protein ACROYT_G028781 [Oculina patagonica]
MAKGLGLWPLALCITLLHIRTTRPKIVEGTLSTKENWAFLTSFCYKDSKGELKYHFEYPETYATQNILLYFDDQWPSVFPKPDMNCTDKEDKLFRGNNQVINLTTDYIWSGCKKKELSSTYLDCTGDRRFVSNRERWWHLAVSNCKSNKGLLLKYRLESTAGDCISHGRSVLPMHKAFFVAFIVVWILGVYEASLKN